VKNSDRAFYILVVLTIAAVVVAIHAIAWAPDEISMGIVYKIVYFHAPAGYGMYLGAAACFVGSCGYLARGTAGWDALARAGGDVAVIMGLMLMISGPLWAAKAWGAYWSWEPRLTTSLLQVLIYMAYVILRSFTSGGDAEKKFAAALGILGAANLPIIHFAVRLWGGMHPQVITGEGGGMNHPDMKLALLYGFIAFTLLSIVLIWLRARQDLTRARLEAAEEEAIGLGVLEDA
jgi:heme exporter protein C